VSYIRIVHEVNIYSEDAFIDWLVSAPP